MDALIDAGGVTLRRGRATLRDEYVDVVYSVPADSRNALPMYDFDLSSWEAGRGPKETAWPCPGFGNELHGSVVNSVFDWNFTA